MLVVRTTGVNGKAAFAEVLRTGAHVQFDQRDGWVLVAKPLHIRPSWRTLEWIHPDDIQIDWVKDFCFEATADV